jgi:hypothetical protein
MQVAPGLSWLSATDVPRWVEAFMPEPKRPRNPLLLAVGILFITAAAGFSVAKIHALRASAIERTIPAWNLSQDDQDTENNEVSPAQVEQYVKVYQLMQRNRSMTVDQAAASQHLTVNQFRDIEARVERDGVLRERVRRELLKTAQEKSNALKLKPQSAPSSSRP